MRKRGNTLRRGLTLPHSIFESHGGTEGFWIWHDENHGMKNRTNFFARWIHRRFSRTGLLRTSWMGLCVRCPWGTYRGEGGSRQACGALLSTRLRDPLHQPRINRSMRQEVLTTRNDPGHLSATRRFPADQMPGRAAASRKILLAWRHLAVGLHDHLANQFHVHFDSWLRFEGPPNSESAFQPVLEVDPVLERAQG